MDALVGLVHAHGHLTSRLADVDAQRLGVGHIALRRHAERVRTGWDGERVVCEAACVATTTQAGATLAHALCALRGTIRMALLASLSLGGRVSLGRPQTAALRASSSKPRAVATPFVVRAAQVAVKTAGGADKGTAELSLKTAGDNSTGLVHKYLVITQTNKRQVRGSGPTPTQLHDASPSGTLGGRSGGGRRSSGRCVVAVAARRTQSTLGPRPNASPA